LNYIKQLNFFWSKSKRHSLGANEIAMYMYLLHTSNVQDWENPVMEPNATLQHAIGVKSFNTLKEIRNKLQQFELIRFRSKNGSGVVEYDIYDVDRQTFSKFEQVAAKVTDEVVDEVAAKVGEKVRQEHYVVNKHKPKPIQQLHSHDVFAEKLFTEEWKLDKQNLELQLSPRREITEEEVIAFNRHLQTEEKHHIHRSEYLKHLRNWLNTKPIIKEKNSAQKETINHEKGRNQNGNNDKLGRNSKQDIADYLAKFDDTGHSEQDN